MTDGGVEIASIDHSVARRNIAAIMLPIHALTLIRTALDARKSDASRQSETIVFVRSVTGFSHAPDDPSCRRGRTPLLVVPICGFG